jgi:hypothetical protein
MQWLSKSVLVVCLVIAFSYPVACEVVKLTVATDSTWKALDIEQPGWTLVDYDDSWWDGVKVANYHLENARDIWYPGSLEPDTAYFRTNFDVSGDSFISGKLYAGVVSGVGSVDLYLNGNSLGKRSNTVDDPAEIDILPYLQPGKNVIAAKVDSTSHLWALVSTIRYETHTSTPAI